MKKKRKPLPKELLEDNDIQEQFLDRINNFMAHNIKHIRNDMKKSASSIIKTIISDKQQ